MNGRELLAQAIADALEVSSHPDCINADELRAVGLDGTFDLLAVADAVVAAVHAEQDQTVRRMLERSPWVAEPSMWQNIVAQVDEWRADEPTVEGRSADIRAAIAEREGRDS